MRIIIRLVILSLLYIPSNAIGGEIIRIKKSKKMDRSRYTYSVTYHDAGSESLKAKMLARKYGGKSAKTDVSEDGLQVQLIKVKR